MRFTLLWLVWWWNAPAASCPDFGQAAQAAADALVRRDPAARSQAIAEAEQALRCGAVVTQWRDRAAFWLAKAVELDAIGDMDGSERALLAAWRTWPDMPLIGVPDTLVRRFLRLVEASPEAPASALQLVPPPPEGAIVIIDGIAASRAAERPGDLGPRYRLAEGTHLLQLIPSIEERRAVAGKVVVVVPEDFPDAPALNVVDVYSTDLGPAVRTPVQLSDNLLSSGPRGGCAAHR